MSVIAIAESRMASMAVTAPVVIRQQMPPLTPTNRVAWWSAVLCAGPCGIWQCAMPTPTHIRTFSSVSSVTIVG